MNARRYDDVFTTGEVAELLGVSPRTIRNWINQGLLKAYTVGGTQRRVVLQELLKFLQANNIPVPAALRRQA